MFRSIVLCGPFFFPPHPLFRNVICLRFPLLEKRENNFRAANIAGKIATHLSFNQELAFTALTCFFLGLFFFFFSLYISDHRSKTVQTYDCVSGRPLTPFALSSFLCHARLLTRDFCFITCARTFSSAAEKTWGLFFLCCRSFNGCIFFSNTRSEIFYRGNFFLDVMVYGRYAFAHK